MDESFRPSPLAVAVLSLLHAGPMHPYAMQRLIKLWGKDRVVNVGQRANLYKTIRRLEEAGLVTVLQTERDQRYPVDGGLFDVPANAPEILVPIRAAVPVHAVKAFAVTIERPGGVVVSARDHVVALGQTS